MPTYASFQVKRKSFYRKSELQMCLLIFGGHIYLCTKTVHKCGVSLQSSTMVHDRFQQKNSETVDLIDLRLGQIVYISVF